MRFKVGDRVKLNDEGWSCMPALSSRKEAEILCGVLTVSEAVDMLTNENPDDQGLFFKETEYICGSHGVDRV